MNKSRSVKRNARKMYDDGSEDEVSEVESINQSKRSSRRNNNSESGDEEILGSEIYRIHGMENAPRKRSSVFCIEIFSASLAVLNFI